MGITTCVLIIVTYSIVTAVLRVAAVNERASFLLVADYLVALLIIIFMCKYTVELRYEVFYSNSLLRKLNAGEFVPDANTTFRIHGEGVRIDATMAPTTTVSTAEATVAGTTP